MGRRGMATGPRSSRTLTLQDAALEYVWLYDCRHGLSLTAIAQRDAVSIGRVRFGLHRARGLQARTDSGPSLEERVRSIRAPGTVPLFPVTSYTPGSACPHHGPIGPGSRLCCMVCHQSGLDGHPALARDARSDPKPDPKPQPPPAAGPGGPATETRRQRRRRLQAAVPPS